MYMQLEHNIFFIHTDVKENKILRQKKVCKTANLIFRNFKKIECIRIQKSENVFKRLTASKYSISL